jgi:hypothetical protein
MHKIKLLSLIIPTLLILLLIPKLYAKEPSLISSREQVMLIALARLEENKSLPPALFSPIPNFFN